MHKKLFALLTFIVCVSAPLSAQQFVFNLSGSQEVPPVPSTASGGCYGELNQPAASFSITCVHNVVGATIMHIHRGAAGVNGAIAFDMGDPSSGFVTATWSGMTATDISDMLAGSLYMNIHTAGRPSGEIRGQILTRTVDTVAFTATGTQVVPPNESTSTANCTANLNDPATALDISCTHNFASPDASHIHEGPFGTNGPIVFTFPDPNMLMGSVPMTARLIADFAATFLYLDMHAAGESEEDPGSEIRGQIGTPPAGAGTGTIIIEKETFPAGATGFQFTETITSTPFTLNDGQTKTFTNVAPGVYSVTESDPSAGNFTLAGVSCDDANSSGNVSTRTATIDVAAGETVRCTFRNLETAPTDQLFVFHLSGDQEVPPHVIPERGGCMARFDVGASELTLVCTHNVDDATIMHIHRGAPGVNGPIVFDLGSPISPVIATWSGMTPANVTDLLGGNYYVNIHSAGRPTGAVRGQMLPRTVDTVAFTLDGSQVVPAGSSTATGNCTANLDDAAQNLAVSCTHNLASPDAAHVHQGERGTNGPVVFTFASPASPINQNVPMTPRLVADFAAQLLYLDIHAAGGGDEETADEIRGQIGGTAFAPTTGTISIVKSTSPAGGAAAFTSDIPTAPGPFTLNDGQTHTFTNVPAGTYTVTETPLAGWSLTDVVCTAGSTGNPFNGTATINLAGGANVTCTFRNLQSVATPTHFVFHLSADQEVPPSSSTARGGCYGQLDQSTRRLALVCTHNVAAPTVTHIHRAPAGSNGPVAFDLGSPVSPIEATWNMTPAEMADLLAGNFYLNIHASGRPEGEIRGQILPRTVDAFDFVANASQEVPPTDSTATGDCSADLADNAMSVFVECTHNADMVIDTHLHAAPPGSDGPVIAHFPNTNSFSGTALLTPRLVADFAAGFLYVNIHTTNYDTGEIRGNLIGTPVPAPVGAAVPTASEWALIVLMAMLAAVALRRIS